MKCKINHSPIPKCHSYRNNFCMHNYPFLFRILRYEKNTFMSIHFYVIFHPFSEPPGPKCKGPKKECSVCGLFFSRANFSRHMKQHTLYEREQTRYDAYDTYDAYDAYESDDECKKYNSKIAIFSTFEWKKISIFFSIFRLKFFHLLKKCLWSHFTYGVWIYNSF